MSKSSMKAKRKWAEDLVNRYPQNSHNGWKLENDTISYYTHDWDYTGYMYLTVKIELETEKVLIFEGIDNSIYNEVENPEISYPELFEVLDDWSNTAFGSVLGELKINTKTYWSWTVSFDKLLKLLPELEYITPFGDIVDVCGSMEQYESIDNDVIYTNITNSNTLKTNVTASDWDELTIYTVDTHCPIITFEKIKNTEEYTFLVDIKDIDDFKYRTTIKTKQDLNEAIDFTVKAFEDSKVFNKYVDDIKKLKL